MKKPKVVEDQIKVRECCSINLTGDHRYLDAGRISHIMDKVNLTFTINSLKFKRILDDPAKCLPEIDQIIQNDYKESPNPQKIE